MTETKDKLVKWVEDKIGDHPADRYKFGIMAQEYAWYRGDQFRVWDQSLGILRDVNIARECRCIYNVCRPIVNMFGAKMLKGDPQPRFQPYPDNTEMTDRSLSSVGNAMSQYWWKTAIEAPLKLRQQVQWGAITGIGIGKIYYDKTKRSGEYTGEIEFDTVNPFHFFPNPDARCDDELRWVIHRFPMEKSSVEDQFGIERGSLLADEKRTVEDKRIVGGRFVDEYISSSDEETVFVHDIWIKKNKEYPKGMHAIVAGGKMLLQEDNPEPETLPFFTFRVKPLPDELYGAGVLRDILTLQRDMNRIESLIQANASFMGNVKWMVSRNAEVLKTSLNNEEFGVVEFDGPIEPKQSQASPLPAHITNRWWDTLRKIQYITGLQDAGSGMIPYRGSQTSPGVIKELKLSEEMIFAQDVAELSDYIRRVMRRYFQLAHTYYSTPRKISIIGENKKPEIIWFDAQKFVNPPDFDVNVGSGFSQSREAKMDQMIQFAQTGIFDKIPGIDWRSIGEELLEYSGLNKIHEDTYRDEYQARNNLMMILCGNDVSVSPYANLQVHKKVFIDYIKQPDYDDLLDEQKAAIDQYIQKIEEMMQPPAQVLPGAPAMGPGNQMPQMQTATEQMDAAMRRRQATGQPVGIEGQGEYMPPPGA